MFLGFLPSYWLHFVRWQSRVTGERGAVGMMTFCAISHSSLSDLRSRNSALNILLNRSFPFEFIKAEKLIAKFKKRASPYNNVISCRYTSSKTWPGHMAGVPRLESVPCKCVTRPWPVISHRHTVPALRFMPPAELPVGVALPADRAQAHWAVLSSLPVAERLERLLAIPGGSTLSALQSFVSQCPQFWKESLSSIVFGKDRENGAGSLLVIPQI